MKPIRVNQVVKQEVWISQGILCNLITLAMLGVHCMVNSGTLQGPYNHIDNNGELFQFSRAEVSFLTTPNVMKSC